MPSKQSLASTLLQPWATFEYNFLKRFLQFFLISFYAKALSIFLTFKLFFPDFLEFDFILIVLGDQWGVVKHESEGVMESNVLNLMLVPFPICLLHFQLHVQSGFTCDSDVLNVELLSNHILNKIFPESLQILLFCCVSMALICTFMVEFTTSTYCV